MDTLSEVTVSGLDAFFTGPGILCWRCPAVLAAELSDQVRTFRLAFIGEKQAQPGWSGGDQGWQIFWRPDRVGMQDRAGAYGRVKQKRHGPFPTICQGIPMARAAPASGHIVTDRAERRIHEAMAAMDEPVQTVANRRDVAGDFRQQADLIRAELG